MVRMALFNALPTSPALSTLTVIPDSASKAASTALLTIYDMCKSIDRGMRIESIQLDEKRGGKSGVWRRDELSGEAR